MTHIITQLCLRDGACVDVCPVECIVGGNPEDQWPWFFIDPATCIDCGACVPECPFEAIFPDGEVPSAHVAKPGQEFVPFGGAKWTAAGGEEVDMTGDAVHNTNFYTEGPGYAAKNM